MALNPFENEAGSLLPRIISSGELSPSRLAGVHKMFFAQVNRLRPKACDAVAQVPVPRRRPGLFPRRPGRCGKPGALGEIFGPNTMPLRLSRRIVATNVTAGAQQIARGDFNRRYLKLFQGRRAPGPRVAGVLRLLPGRRDQRGRSAAGHMAMDRRRWRSMRYGLGTALLMNFSAGEFSSNLSRQRIFPAWMQDLVKALSTDEPPPSSYVDRRNHCTRKSGAARCAID